jgi:hypothetical protein
MPCQRSSVISVLRPLRSDSQGLVRLRGLRTEKIDGRGTLLDDSVRCAIGDALPEVFEE